MEAYSFSDICRMATGIPKGPDISMAVVKELLTDSRRLVLPSGTLFVALKTSKNDGHKYIPEMLAKGVKMFMVSKLSGGFEEKYPEASFILVDDTLAALQRLVSEHRKRFNLPVVAITGSNGKTIIKEWLYQLLMDRRNIVRNPRSYNSQIGVPLSVWQINTEHQLGIFEAGISRKGEMENLMKVIQPDIGIFTNIGPAHDEGFASTREKVSEKLRLFTNCRGLIYCADHPELASGILSWQKKNSSVKLFGWSSQPGASMQVLSLTKQGNITHIRVIYHQKTFSFKIPFSDKASVENALHCLAFLFFAGYSNGWIKERIGQLQSIAMRMEMKEGINNSMIINDSYNSDLNSLVIALDFLNAQSRHKKHTLILSDILQTGMEVSQLYTQVAAMVAARNISRFIGIGKDISSQKKVFPPDALFFPDSETFIREFDFKAFREEAILVKGARVFGFENISSLLQQKDHQTILEINLEALVHNLNVFRSLLNPGVKVMAMVKAFSYGSGSVEIAGMLQYHKVDYLAVAYADEGKELRQGGINMPVVVMNPEIRSFDILMKYDLQPEVYSISVLKRLAEEVSQASGFSRQNPFAVHLKLDTGMHRLGIMPGQTKEMLDILASNPHLKVHSVFSHLAASDEKDHDGFSNQQINLFKDWADSIRDFLGYEFLRHICNTSAISRFPEAHLDMVRPGIGLYGISGDPAIQEVLHNVSTFKSVISQVKDVEAGQTIGYNRTARAGQDTRIAIIPVGYADGLSRRLGNGVGKFFVKGHLLPVVGNISMDMCAVDITGKDINEGEEVIIFGKDNPVQNMAASLQTIPYEIFTTVSQRVKRIYFHE